MAHGALIAEIEDWLLGEALRHPDVMELFGELCTRLHALGLPIDRAAMSWPTVHPLFRAEQVTWRPESGAVLEQYHHEELGLDSARFLKSPFHHVHSRGLTRFRRRLTGPEALLDFDILSDLAAAGFTDYLLTATTFRIAEAQHFAGGSTGIMATWSSKRESGFSSDDFDAFSRIQRVFAVACHAAIQERVMENIAAAYLGPTAAARVMRGDIRRGDGERIEAVLWFSDLRGSTGLSERMEPDDYLALLNRYYECTAQPVLDHGGEILNFIGDGVFAIFPVGAEGLAAAAARGEAAARQALALGCAARAAGLPPGGALAFGIGLSVGEVMFGNIGVPGRLAFSGIGQSVNQLSRIEAATKTLGHPLLADAPFARAAPGPWQSVGLTELRGVTAPAELFTLPTT